MSNNPVIASLDKLQDTLNGIQLDINNERLNVISKLMHETRQELLRLQRKVDSINIANDICGLNPPGVPCLGNAGILRR